jgi:hypothetical protein
MISAGILTATSRQYSGTLRHRAQSVIPILSNALICRLRAAKGPAPLAGRNTKPGFETLPE